MSTIQRSSSCTKANATVHRALALVVAAAEAAEVAVAPVVEAAVAEATVSRLFYSQILYLGFLNTTKRVPLY